jgi:hypothetical protein
VLEPRYTAAATLTGSTSGTLELRAISATLSVSLMPFLQGPPGAAAAISGDGENRLTNGSDGGLFVPELTVDPVAYYILAKA